MVVGVRRVADEESVCISVDSPDSLYVTSHCALTHNTIITIGTMMVAFRRGTAKRAILVVPSSIKFQWHSEILRFARRLPKPVVVASGGRKARRRLYTLPWRVLLINPELLRRDVSLLESIVPEVQFSALDEASCIRNPDTDTALAMKHLFKRTRYKLALTATPVENCLADLRSIFEWVDPRVFLSRRHFNDRYVVWKKRRFKVRKRNGREVTVTRTEPASYKHLDEAKAKISHCYIRRRFKDVELELPDLVVKWETVILPKRQRALYEAVKSKVAAKIMGLRGAALRAPLQALRQACNSTLLIERKRSRGRPAHVKIDRLRELLETELVGEQVVLFTDYERFARVLKEELKAYRPATFTGPMGKRERQRALEAFRAGTKQLLIGTKALERGHNLQTAAIVINVDLPFNPAVIKQRIGRVRRIGSEHGCCRMINMLAKDTVEEKLILGKLYSKRKLFEGIFEEDELTTADPLARMAGADLRELL